MDSPRIELKTNTDERRDSPELGDLVPPEELVAGDHIRDDLFDVVFGSGSPATAGEIADLAGHGIDAVREYLEWFERMGIVA